MIGMSKYFVDHTYDLTELHKQHGSVFMINFGLVLGGWNLAVSDMESIKDVLSSDGNRFVSSWPGAPKLLSPSSLRHSYRCTFALASLICTCPRN